MAEKTTIEKAIRDEIVTQALSEISHARTYKQGKITNWQKNESMYYGIKTPSTEARANVNLGRMQEFVHTLQSKIANQQIFKFVKRKEAQLKRVKRLNALRDVDRVDDNWDLKILVGSKQLAIYGREIYNYYADSIDKIYRPHLKNVDVYDFLIDPAAGGLDIEEGNYMGDFGVVYTRQELEDADDDMFIKDEVTALLAGVGNASEMSKEDLWKQNRSYGQGTVGKKQIEDKDKFKFWRWFTTYKGERYYLLLQEKPGTAIRVEKLKEMASPSRLFPKGAWPYWSNAAFPDLTEFWTPSYCDYVREIFMAQDVTIDQALDNAEQINKPMKVVNVNAIEDLGKLKYRKDRIIPTKNNIDANRAVQILETTSIETPLKVFEVLEGIQEKMSGITAAAKGAASNNGDDKATIYVGNQKETQGRFDLLDMSRSFGMGRFARLYEIGVRDNLIKKVAVDMIGPEGIETEEVKRSDIFKKNDDFATQIEDSQAETDATTQQAVVKINFLNAELNNQTMMGKINPKVAFEIKAKIAGVDEEDIKRLLDVSEYGSAEIMSEAARDIESILDGDKIKPNQNANNAYKQRFVDFMSDHEEDMTDKQFIAMVEYVKEIDPIIVKNETRAINAIAMKQMALGATDPSAPVEDPNAPIINQEINQDEVQV